MSIASIKINLYLFLVKSSRTSEYVDPESNPFITLTKSIPDAQGPWGLQVHYVVIILWYFDYLQICLFMLYATQKHNTKLKGTLKGGST